MDKFEEIMEGLKKFNVVFLTLALILGLTGFGLVLTPVSLFGQEGVSAQPVSRSYAGWAFLAAGLSISVSVLGAGIALSKIGSSAMAALAEKPEIMGAAIVFAGLAEGLSIWGLIVAVLILIKV
ncbi:MAG: ATP synthase subunit C [candidate division WOR-3 bacterium]